MDTPWSSTEFHRNLMDLRGVPWNHHGISLEFPWNICRHSMGASILSFMECDAINEHQRVNYQHNLDKNTVTLNSSLYLANHSSSAKTFLK